MHAEQKGIVLHPPPGIKGGFRLRRNRSVGGCDFTPLLRPKHSEVRSEK